MSTQTKIQSKEEMLQHLRIMIYLSITLTDYQKESLLKKLPSFTDYQLDQLQIVFHHEHEEKNKLLFEKFKTNPALASKYKEELSKISKNAFDHAQSKDGNNTNSNQQILLKQLDNI